MTPAEERLWNALRRKQLDGLKFRAQHPVEHYILDFYCHECKLVVELDGSVHETTAEYDEARTSFLNAHGLKVVRFANSAVEQDLSAVLEQIRLAARSNA